MFVWVGVDVYFCHVADQQLTDVQAKENVFHLLHSSCNMLSNILTYSILCEERKFIIWLHLYNSEWLGWSKGHGKHRCNHSLKWILHIMKKKKIWWRMKWWPILGICALHLTHPSAHTQQWVVDKHTHTHTPRAAGSHWCCGTRGAVGGLVPCSRVSPKSWYWGWTALDIDSPHLQSLPDLRLEPTTFGL